MTIQRDYQDKQFERQIGRGAPLPKKELPQNYWITELKEYWRQIRSITARAYDHIRGKDKNHTREGDSKNLSGLCG
jgi:hypothetical protein